MDLGLNKNQIPAPKPTTLSKQIHHKIFNNISTKPVRG